MDVFTKLGNQRLKLRDCNVVIVHRGKLFESLADGFGKHTSDGVNILRIRDVCL